MAKKKATKSKKIVKPRVEGEEQTPLFDDYEESDESGDENEDEEDTMIDEESPALAGREDEEEEGTEHVFEGETIEGVKVGDTFASTSNPGAVVTVTAANLEEFKARKKAS